MHKVAVGVLGVLAVAWGAHAIGAEGPNLVRNGGFEAAGDKGLPAQWRCDPVVYARDEKVKQSGVASLRIANADPGVYRLCSQSVQLEPGRMYAFSVWVKTEGVEGSDSGATICVEYSDADGKYVSGQYPSGVSGTSDWKKIEANTGRVPEKAASCSITCYLRKEMTGTAWWDDVEIRAYKTDPLTVLLLDPNYRNEITKDGPDKVRLHVETDLSDYPQSLDDVDLICNVVAPDRKKPVASERLKRLGEAAFDIELPGKKLKPGDYQIQVALRDRESGKQLSAKAVDIVRLKERPERTCAIDEHNRLIVNGEPFFPLGMYWSAIKEDQLAVYADSAFNCMMPYGMPTMEQMDQACKHGLKVIYSVKDCYTFIRWHPKEVKTQDDELPYIQKKIEMFRNHPALLAWYINDEAPVSVMPQLVAHHRFIEEQDPNHPTWVVLYQVNDVRDYFDTFHVIGTDPYPIPAKPAATAGEWTQKTIDAVGGRRSVWMVPQVFNWASYKKSEEEKAKCRPPTYDEMRSMTWQCIARGANGLVFYSWFNIWKTDKHVDHDDHWPKVKSIAAEVDALSPAILSVESVPKIACTDAASGGDAVWLDWTVRRLGKKVYLIAVNNSPEAHIAQVRFPKRPEAVAALGKGLKVDMRVPRDWPLAFEPFEVHLYEVSGIM
ncbi:MAG: hypothetical protein GY851_02630 [bacterium]|nr:hypothetical protein [bacterium]